MEHLNFALFYWLNASVQPSHLELVTATFLAEYLIFAIPALLIGIWICGNSWARAVAIEATLSGFAALAVNQLIGLFWQHPRPFMIGVGHTYLSHIPDSSFPSDHLTLWWAVTFGLSAHHRVRWLSLPLALLGLGIAWARIYLGVHFPLDMVGSALVAMCVVALVKRYARGAISTVADKLCLLEARLLRH